MWLTRYRWIFLPATLILLGFAYYQTYKKKDGNKNKCSIWSRLFLHSTTILSLGLVFYTLIKR